MSSGILIGLPLCRAWKQVRILHYLDAVMIRWDDINGGPKNRASAMIGICINVKRALRV